MRLRQLNLSTKITLAVSTMLVLLMVLGASVFVYHQYSFFRNSAEHKLHDTLQVIESFHVQAMLHRKHTETSNPVVITLDQSIEAINTSSDHIKLWLVMSEPIMAYQRKIGGEIEPPRDAVDREAIATKQTIFREDNENHMLRMTKPVIMGDAPADREECISCHETFGQKVGDVIGAYSVSFDLKDERINFISLVILTTFITLIISVLVAVVNTRLINRLAGTPIRNMTQAMRQLANDDLNVEVPFENSSGEIGEMAASLHVFKKNAQLKRKAEMALIVAKERAEEASKSKSSFLANMSHELRTPLNAIIGFSQAILTRSFGEIENKRHEEYIVHIHESGEHLLKLINDVLDISKIEAGKMHLSNELFDVAEVASMLKASSAPLIKKNGNSFTVNCPDDIGIIFADRTRLQQILLNLLSNAAKFTEKGQILLDISRANDAPDADFIFKVTDTGIGIAPDKIETLFDSFVQAEDSINKKYGGTGLGLAISKTLCEMMGGRIELESVLGEGSTFTITLPMNTESHNVDFDI